MRTTPLLLASALALSALPAAAHQPNFATGDETGPDTAFRFPDLMVSRVVYADLECPAEPFWVTFDAEAGDSLFLQLGTPVMPALEGYRPTLALLGPGLPAVNQTFPFVIPAGLGALTFPTETVTEPERFFEPFTQTSSWILLERTLTLDEAGTYYAVAYDEPAKHGRLWIATGTEEVPGGDLDLPRIKAFHEESTASDLGLVCEEEASVVGGGVEGCSCEAAGQGGGAGGKGLFAALAVGAVVLRRRSRLG